MIATDRDGIFISYAHKDDAYMQRLRAALKPLESDGIKYWVDRDIEAGNNWAEDIKNALASSRVAVLLISIDFFASTFITKEELPFILEAAERKELRILSVLLKDSMFKDTKLSKYQTINPPEKLLGNLRAAKRDEYWQKLQDTIRWDFRDIKPLPFSKQVSIVGRDAVRALKRPLFPVVAAIAALVIASVLYFRPHPTQTESPANAPEGHLNAALPPEYDFVSPWNADWSALDCGSAEKRLVRISKTCPAIVSGAGNKQPRDFDLLLGAQLALGEDLAWMMRVNGTSKNLSGYAFRLTRDERQFHLDAEVIDNGQKVRLTPTDENNFEWELALRPGDFFLIHSRIVKDALTVWISLDRQDPELPVREFAKTCRKFGFKDARFAYGWAALLPPVAGAASANVEFWQLQAETPVATSCEGL